MFFDLPDLMAQQVAKIYTGTVTDTKGEPLIGVSIVVKGTTTGTVSDINGKFSLQSISQNPTIAFSYIGYESKEISPKSSEIPQIELRETNKQLEDVVVVGYGTMRKKRPHCFSCPCKEQ